MINHDWHPFATKDPSTCIPTLHRSEQCSYLVYERWLALSYFQVNSIFFTDFHWLDTDGLTCRVTTRSDLINVYVHYAVQKEFYSRLLDLLRTPTVALVDGDDDRQSLIDAVDTANGECWVYRSALSIFLGRLHVRETSGRIPLYWYQSQVPLNDPVREQHCMKELPDETLSTFSFRLSEDLKEKERRHSEDPTSDMRPGWVRELLKRLPESERAEFEESQRSIVKPAMPWVGFVESAMEAKTQNESTPLSYSAATTIATQSLDTSTADIERQPRLDDRTVTQRHTWQVHDS